jgi:peroxiredoxin
MGVQEPENDNQVLKGEIMIRSAALACVLLLSSASMAQAAAIIGKAAPAFELKNSSGKAVRLDSFRGKYVVLEWVNFECPFVKKHYNSGNMQQLQKSYTEKGVVWLTICSSAKGKQGYMTETGARDMAKERGAASTHFLLDPKGTVGKAYGAKTTPNMFVIDPKGILVYNGAIDDKPSTDKADVPGATNYVVAALDQSMAGKEVETPATQPYGCSVKY